MHKLIRNVFVSPADDLSSQDQFEVPEAGGWDAMLNEEDEDYFFDLQIVKHYDGEVRIIVVKACSLASLVVTVLVDSTG